MKQKLFKVFVFCLLFSNAVFAQTKKITGKVTGADDGQPIAFVTVKVPGTTIGTQTNTDGNYEVSVPATAKSIEFTHVGLRTVVENIGDRTQINVKMSTFLKLEEVVVTGYGTGRMLGTVVGSVTTVNSKALEDRPTANAFDALQGKVAGLQVFTSSGEPSTPSTIRLHGIGSLGANPSPLYLLDGIQVESQSVVGLNPNDIESVSVLKDASATSIYGARGANGVIYITTKRGEVGKSSITVQSQYSIQNIAENSFYKNIMNTNELTAFWIKTGYRTQAQVDELLAKFPNDFKWFDYYFKKNTPLQQTSLNISGGSGNTTYYVSGSYFKAEGIMYHSGFERYTFRSNLNTSVNKYLKLGLNLTGDSDNTQINEFSGAKLDGGLALLAEPFYSPYDVNGKEYYGQPIPGTERYSPRYLADMFPKNYHNLQLNPSVYVLINPFKGLTFKSQAGFDGYDYRTTAKRLPSYSGEPNNGGLSEEFERAITKTFTNTLEYKFNLQDNNFTALAGQEYIDNTFTSFSASTSGLRDDRLILLGNGDQTTRHIGSNKTEYAYKSLFGKLEYNFENRFFVDGSLRQDKSSRFGKNHQSATFWSVGGMWRIKKERFLQNLHWIDNLDLRISTGTSGNSSIGNYESLTTVGLKKYAGEDGYHIATSGNPLLGWEFQHKTTLGLKISLYNKVRVDLELYSRVTKNQLIDVPYAFTSGFSRIKSNIGAIQNKGIDLSIQADVWENSARKGYFSPYLNVNINRDKITELFQAKQYWYISGTAVAWVLGKPVSYFLPMWKGVNPENGNPEWYLPNTGDQVIITRRDANAVTSTFSSSTLQQYTGINRYPWLNGGFGFNSGFQGFTFDLDFSFSGGKYLGNNDRYYFENPSMVDGLNQSKSVQDYWTTPGQQSKFPKYGVQFTQLDDRLIENASFIRLKNIRLGYSFSEAVLKSTKVLKGAKIFVIGRNLLTFTKYTGPDPEIDANISVGVNPNTKQIGLGMQLKF